MTYTSAFRQVLITFGDVNKLHEGKMLNDALIDIGGHCMITRCEALDGRPIGVHIRQGCMVASSLVFEALISNFAGMIYTGYNSKVYRMLHSCNLFSKRSDICHTFFFL